MQNRVPRIGFIGLGDMGLPMARRLVAAGLEVVAWNRSAAKLALLAAEGAIAARSPAQVARDSDLIGLCLISHDTVEQVLMGSEGLLAGLAEHSGCVIADFTTGDPDAAIRFGALVRPLGSAWVDAPVSGGPQGAENGTLIVFAGGEAADVAALEPLFSPVAARTNHMGPQGAGQSTKIVNNMIFACNVLMMAEALVVARRAGIEASTLPKALKGGWADSLPMQILGPRMAVGQFLPRTGAIELLAKDVGLARGLAARVGGISPMADFCAQLIGRVGDRDDIAWTEDVCKLVRLFE